MRPDMIGSRLQSQCKAASDTSRVPLQTGLLQRKCDCGNHTIAGNECNGCGKKRQTLLRSAISPAPANGSANSGPSVVNEALDSRGHALDATTRNPSEPSFRHNFSRVPVSSDGSQSQTATILEHDQVNYQTPPSGVAPAASPTGPPLALSPTVDRITLVTGTPATTGYPAILGNSDLNTPGPFNHAATGEVTNVHQILFHLDQGNSSALTAVRVVRATFTIGTGQVRFPTDLPGDPGGVGGTRTHSDGPPPHEIMLPTTDTFVVADAPGIRALSAAQYPFGLSADFDLKVTAAGTDIARIKYGVRISKTSATNIPNAQNTVSVTEKEDIVRGRSLV